MTLKEYSKLAREFNVVDEERRESHALCGLVEEVGEFLGEYKRALRGDHDFDRKKALEELSDLIWYVNECALNLGSDLSEIAEINLEKLTKRKLEGTIKGRGGDR